MTCIHKRTSSRNIQIDGVLINQQCFTHPLIVLDLDSCDPHANVNNSMELAFLKQTPEALSISKDAQDITREYISDTCYAFQKDLRDLESLGISKAVSDKIKQ